MRISVSMTSTSDSDCLLVSQGAVRDQDSIEAAQHRPGFLDQPSVFLEDGEVGREDLDPRGAAGSEVGGDGFEAGGVAADEDDLRPVCCEGLRRLAGNRGGRAEYSQSQALLPFVDAVVG